VIRLLPGSERFGSESLDRHDAVTSLALDLLGDPRR
jgi:hypothetical protein